MSLESATQLALFLAGIWAATKAMLDATAFVNALRDTVVIGRKDGETLTHSHRRTLRNDWLLTIVCRQSISDSWLGNLREYLAHLV
jgi:hypothetical protein